jgi:hypothetical protein
VDVGKNCLPGTPTKPIGPSSVRIGIFVAQTSPNPLAPEERHLSIGSKPEYATPTELNLFLVSVFYKDIAPSGAFHGSFHQKQRRTEFFFEPSWIRVSYV